MCARYNLRLANRQLQEYLNLSAEPAEYPLRYNISPTQFVPTVSLVEGKRLASDRKWGLIPSWSKDTKLAATMINARSETVAEKPAFRSAIKKRRCLIPASAFYEWTGPAKAKQPWMIEFTDGKPMIFAGIWEAWRNPEGETIESCSILTTAANEFMSQVHDRMPVLLVPEAWDFWLDPEIQTADPYRQLFESWPHDDLKRTAVSPKLNNSKNEGAAIFERL